MTLDGAMAMTIPASRIKDQFKNKAPERPQEPTVRRECLQTGLGRRIAKRWRTLPSTLI